MHDADTLSLNALASLHRTIDAQVFVPSKSIQSDRICLCGSLCRGYRALGILWSNPMSTLTNGIPLGNPPAELEALEREKSRLLFDAHLLKAQHRYTEAADHFTQVAEIERQWAGWAETARLDQLAIIHRHSELSCWAQAGYPHRALQLTDALLDHGALSAD